MWPIKVSGYLFHDIFFNCVLKWNIYMCVKSIYIKIHLCNIYLLFSLIKKKLLIVWIWSRKKFIFFSLNFICNFKKKEASLNFFCFVFKHQWKTEMWSSLFVFVCSFKWKFTDGKRSKAKNQTNFYLLKEWSARCRRRRRSHMVLYRGLDLASGSQKKRVQQNIHTYTHTHCNKVEFKKQ